MLIIKWSDTIIKTHRRLYQKETWSKIHELPPSTTLPPISVIPRNHLQECYCKVWDPLLLPCHYFLSTPTLQTSYIHAPFALSDPRSTPFPTHPSPASKLRKKLHLQGIFIQFHERCKAVPLLRPIQTPGALLHVRLQSSQETYQGISWNFKQSHLILRTQA